MVAVLLIILQPREESMTVGAVWTQMTSGFALLLATVMSNRRSYFDTVHVQRLIFFSGTPLVHMMPYFVEAEWVTVMRELRDPENSLYMRRKALSGLAIILYLTFLNMFTILLSARSDLDTDPCIASMRFYFSFIPVSGADNACFLLQLEIIVPTIINLYVAYSERARDIHPLHQLAMLLAGIVMHIPSIELSLRQGTLVDDAEWTLGQILALLSIAPLLVQLSFAVGKIAEEIWLGSKRSGRG
ncbi:hypothetical protein PsYK624_102200 [Phanerochaete sordida]|uniref:Uncharacterized protein n=1 Tax=Phanerochaete sordida TaxID=48140 RepID=A0A9P3GFR4_9APHY|nr:hypothetical protein PsYK624_102200 [Phanerochaete sordida]